MLTCLHIYIEISEFDWYLGKYEQRLRHYWDWNTRGDMRLPKPNLKIWRLQLKSPFSLIALYVKQLRYYWDRIWFLTLSRSHLNGRWSSRLYTGSPAQRRSICSRCMQLNSSIWCCKRQLYSSSTSAQRSSRASQQCSRSVSIHSLLQQA